MRTICNECQGENILQQATIMVDLQDLKEPDFHVDLGGLVFDDYYYCTDCERDVWVSEVE